MDIIIIIIVSRTLFFYLILINLNNLNRNLNSHFTELNTCKVQACACQLIILFRVSVIIILK